MISVIQRSLKNDQQPIGRGSALPNGVCILWWHAKSPTFGVIPERLFRMFSIYVVRPERRVVISDSYAPQGKLAMLPQVVGQKNCWLLISASRARSPNKVKCGRFCKF